MNLPERLITKKHKPGWQAVEVVSVCYIILTTILLAVFWNKMADPLDMVFTRAKILGVMAVGYIIYRVYPCILTYIVRMLPSTFALIAWYPETYQFCRLWNYQDHIFARIDQWMFGCQPSLEFSRLLPGTFWVEAFNMGYYSYYYMFVVMFFFYYIYREKEANRAGFIFLASFFIFYLVFFFLPTGGPQYYFVAIGLENANAGVFPDIGNYLANHCEIMPLDVRGVFSRLVLHAQEVGEHPTAAFPSSHVGMSTITMLLINRTRNRRLLLILMPFYILLCLATVYIKAHYAIDSICGVLFAVLLYLVMGHIYDYFKLDDKLKRLRTL